MDVPLKLKDEINSAQMHFRTGNGSLKDAGPLLEEALYINQSSSPALNSVIQAMAVIVEHLTEVDVELDYSLDDTTFGNILARFQSTITTNVAIEQINLVEIHNTGVKVDKLYLIVLIILLGKLLCDYQSSQYSGKISNITNLLVSQIRELESSDFTEIHENFKKSSDQNLKLKLERVVQVHGLTDIAFNTNQFKFLLEETGRYIFLQAELDKVKTFLKPIKTRLKLDYKSRTGGTRRPFQARRFSRRGPGSVDM